MLTFRVEQILDCYRKAEEGPSLILGHRVEPSRFSENLLLVEVDPCPHLGAGFHAIKQGAAELLDREGTIPDALQNVCRWEPLHMLHTRDV